MTDWHVVWTAGAVEVMQKELQDLQPVLEETAVEVEAMMVQIEADKAAAAVTKAQVQEQEAAANEKAAAAKAIADDAQVWWPAVFCLLFPDPEEQCSFKSSCEG